MGRRKKSKLSPRSTITENFESTTNCLQLKDDPGGGLPHSIETIMPQTHIPLEKPISTILSSSIQQQQHSLTNVNDNLKNVNHSIPPPPPPTNSSDLKYLHKKFKRIASATIDIVDQHHHHSSNSSSNNSSSSSSKITINSETSIIDNTNNTYKLNNNNDNDNDNSSNSALNSKQLPPQDINDKPNNLIDTQQHQQHYSNNNAINDKSLGLINKLSDQIISTGTSSIATPINYEELIRIHEATMPQQQQQQHALSLHYQPHDNNTPFIDKFARNFSANPNETKNIDSSYNFIESKKFVYNSLSQYVQHYPSEYQSQIHPQHHQQSSQQMFPPPPTHQQHQHQQNHVIPQGVSYYTNTTPKYLSISNLITTAANTTQPPASSIPITGNVTKQLSTSTYSSVDYRDHQQQLQRKSPLLNQQQITNRSNEKRNSLASPIGQIISASSSTATVAAANKNVYNVASSSTSSLSTNNINNTTISIGSGKLSNDSHTNVPGKYICPYSNCQLNCTKPSVLQKHIRTHTNERPYPCVPCGYAFKTRSNLYKHCRSRTHGSKLQGVESQPDDEISIGSDQDQEISSSGSDVISQTASPIDDRMTLSPSSSQQIDKPYKPKFHDASLYTKEESKSELNSLQKKSSSVANFTHSVSDTGQSTLSSAAAAAAANNVHPLTTQNVEYLKEHISKIISQNEAIMEVVEPALQKKYHKITGISRGLVINENSSSKLAMAVLKQREESLNNKIISATATADGAIASCSNSVANTSGGSSNSGGGNSGARRVLPSLQQQAQHVLQTQVYQPLNLTTNPGETSDMLRKRCISEGFSAQDITSHPQNPERSIIKDLLLNSRKMAAAAAALANSAAAASDSASGNQDETTFSCSLCKITFRSADNLKYHTKNYCQGGNGGTGSNNVLLNPGESPQSAPISPVASPSHKYFRSNSFNVNLPEKYNPNTLAKLASSTLKHPSQTPMSLAKLAQTYIKPPKPKLDNIVIVTESFNSNCNANVIHQPQQHYDSINTPSSQLTKLFDTSLPSPGPLLGKTRLVDTYNNVRKNDEATISHVSPMPDEHKNCKNLNNNNNEDKYGQSIKRARFDSYNMNSPSFLSSDPSSSSSHTKVLSMCGGEIKMIEKREETIPRFGSSGGSIVSISPSPDAIGANENNSIIIGYRTGLHSGGSTVVEPLSAASTSSLKNKQIPTLTLTPAHDSGRITNNIIGQNNRYFQFPPINSITGYNPLTLPPVTDLTMSPSAATILHDGRMIPFVPGIPGPHSLLLKPSSEFVAKSNQKPNSMHVSTSKLNNRYASSNIVLPPPKQQIIDVLPNDTGAIHNHRIDSFSMSVAPPKTDEISYNNPTQQFNSYTKKDKKSFNFTRMADNVSPVKPTIVIDRPPSSNKLSRTTTTTPEPPIYFNFDTSTKFNLIVQQPSKSPHYNQSQQSPCNRSPLHIDVTFSPPNLPPPPPTTTVTSSSSSSVEQSSSKSSRFLRPTSLPLKPGTFTPKRHHGITPTANTLPLISPETPRPSKNCIQLYLNGHAYTYLGLKCSTKTFYCTVNRPQPVHFTSGSQQQKLSIYSNWQTCAESDPHPMGLSPKQVMSLYDSRHRPTNYSTARISEKCKILHSQSLLIALTNQQQDNNNLTKTYQQQQSDNQDFDSMQHHHQHNVNTSCGSKCSSGSSSGSVGTTFGKYDRSTVIPNVPGGYESNEDYTYVRGRGRGRYVCSQCGIRCKKPSMLKKHIKTHSNERPYTCKYCIISFKTKGNLTKHMKSKSHYKECVKLGIYPLPIMVTDDDGMDDEMDDESITNSDRTNALESDSDDIMSDDDGDNENSDGDDTKTQLPEHEAARCLLFLSRVPTTSINVLPNLIPSRPTTYPYVSRQNSIKSITSTVIMPTQSPSLSTTTTSSSSLNRHQRLSISNPSPKSSSDFYSTTEQYYAEPKIACSPKTTTTNVISNSNLLDTNMPIDLTKPRSEDAAIFNQLSLNNNAIVQQSSMSPNVSDIVTMYSGPAGLLTTLVSLTDKVPNIMSNHHTNNVDDNGLLQTYLTERALLDSKIKQSQMYRVTTTLTTATTMTASTSSSCIVSSSSSPFVDNYEILNVIENSPTITDISIATTTNDKIIDKSATTSLIENENLTIVEQMEIDEQSSGMNTLAEIAASSVKLDVQPIESVPSVAVDSSKISNSAKSVASEYLKMTSVEYMKAHQYNKSDREYSEDSDSESEHETTGGPYEYRSNLVQGQSANESIQPSTTNGGGSSSSTGIIVRTVVVGGDGFRNKSSDLPVVVAAQPTVHHSRGSFIQEDGPSVCTTCSKTFPKTHQMVLHSKIHIMEQTRKYRCEVCPAKFRSQGHLQKHERSEGHKNNILRTSTFGVATTTNPRPFQCLDCTIGFRIHGHLAKHLRSKTHVQKLENLQKLPFGTYAEIERAGISLTDIDTSTCENSLTSLRSLAQKLLEKDPSKLAEWSTIDGQMHATTSTAGGESNSDDGGETSSVDEQNNAIIVTVASAVSSSSTTSSSMMVCENNDFNTLKRKHDLQMIGNNNGGIVTLTNNSIFVNNNISSSSSNSNNKDLFNSNENHEKRLKTFSDT